MVLNLHIAKNSSQQQQNADQAPADTVEALRNRTQRTLNDRAHRADVIRQKRNGNRDAPRHGARSQRSYATTLRPVPQGPSGWANRDRALIRDWRRLPGRHPARIRRSLWARDPSIGQGVPGNKQALPSLPRHDPAQPLGQRTVALRRRVLVAQRHGHVAVPATVQQLSQRRALLGVERQPRVLQVVEPERRPPFLARLPPRDVEGRLRDTRRSFPTPLSTVLVTFGPKKALGAARAPAAGISVLRCSGPSPPWGR